MIYAWSSRVVSACWIIFALVWMLASLSTKRTIRHESAATRVSYLLVIVLGYIFIVISRAFPYPLGPKGVMRPEWIGVLAAAFCVAGLAVAVWARMTLGRNWSGVTTLKADHELIRRGPYRLMRHPIYTGVLMMILAVLLLRGGLGGMIGLVVICIGFGIKIRSEEKLMLQQFPNEYAMYQKRVKRLIPFLF